MPDPGGLALLTKVRKFPDLAIEALLRLGFAIQPVRDAGWRLPDDLRSRVSVRWPRRYQWAPLARGGDQIRDMLGRRVRVEYGDIAQPFQGTVVSEFVVDGRPHGIAFIMSDYPDLVDDRCVRENLVSFKFQFRDGGYADPRIVPGGYLPASPVLYPMLPYLRWSKDTRRSLFDVYGRFSMEFSPGIRGDTLRCFAESSKVRFFGGRYRVRYSRYLREVARARVCVDLPGQGPLCHRLIEYLAIGACVVARPHRTQTLAPLADGTDVVYGNSPEEAVDCSRAILDDPERQQAMVRASRAFFDRHLHRDQLSAYYLSTALAAATAA